MIVVTEQRDFEFQIVGPGLRERFTQLLTNGAEPLGWAEVLAAEYPDGWVYIHVEYRVMKE